VIIFSQHRYNGSRDMLMDSRRYMNLHNTSFRIVFGTLTFDGLVPSKATNDGDQNDSPKVMLLHFLLLTVLPFKVLR
jgi:hypothetical protein